MESLGWIRRDWGGTSFISGGHILNAVVIACTARWAVFLCLCGVGHVMKGFKSLHSFGQIVKLMAVYVVIPMMH